MRDRFDLYTGTLQYRGINFTFAFNERELRLIPPEDYKHVIERDWKMKQIGNGVYTLADPIPIEEAFLVGYCNETKHRIVFIPEQGSYLHLNNSVVDIELTAYVICRIDRDVIDRVTFSCPEIDYIHPTNQAFSLAFSQSDFEKTGIVTLSTADFDTTTTEKQRFPVEDSEVSMYFSISRNVSTKISEPPLSLRSALVFEFDATNDYSLILRLWWIARDFIRFLCYRRNIYIPMVELSAPFNNGKHEDFATMYILGQDKEVEQETLRKGRHIKLQHIENQAGRLLADITEGNIYLRHLPDTYQTGRHIDAARFVMITAAFEWEFHRLYPNGIKKSEETIAAESAVSEAIQQHITETTGKQKNIYKFLKRLVKSDSLQSEIIQIGKDFSDIIDVFGNRLYHLNGQELKYSEMGQRLSDQRNHFAHGDLDKDFIGPSLLDLMYMEYVIYAMQLKYYGIEDIEIQRSINELFHLSIAI